MTLPSPSTPDDRYLNSAEAARLLGLSESYLKALRGEGGGPRFAKFGEKAVRYRMGDLHAWAAERTVGSTSEQVAA